LTSIGSYEVKIRVKSGIKQVAFVSPAKADDMPTNWTFDWPGLWHMMNFECENIVKLVVWQINFAW
jgi:hypothetical protein